VVTGGAGRRGHPRKSNGANCRLAPADWL
jgi:hypothetical protein